MSEESGSGVADAGIPTLPSLNNYDQSANASAANTGRQDTVRRKQKPEGQRERDTHTRTGIMKN
jgi:hypothetical protein